MDIQPDAAYDAMQTRDARFDGRLFIGVTSTGVYCRPVCRVRPPKRENCRFFGGAAQAEAQGFRPCLRCRPELAPGLSLADSSQALATQAASWLLQAAQAGDAVALPALAKRLGVTDRHLRRIFLQAHGVSAQAYLTTQRLLLAKHLLTDTALPITQVGMSAGFGSLRRFNAAFSGQYRMSPSALRRHRSAPAAGDTALRLAWRPPYDHQAMLAFLRERALPGVEQVTATEYRRTLALQHQGQALAGWLALRFEPARQQVWLAAGPGLLPALGALAARARHALDLNAEPQRIHASIAPLEQALGMPARPGLRLPGTLCGFELAVRAVLGQQVTVAAARTLAQRLVATLGTPLATPWPGVERLFPSAAAVAEASDDCLGRLGIVRQRVRALKALAQAMASGALRLEPGAPLEPTLAALQALPGIGPWTAQLVAMRALAWPDAFPASDIGLLNALGHRDSALAGQQAQAWRPWRAYAVIRLWAWLGERDTAPQPQAA